MYSFLFFTSHRVHKLRNLPGKWKMRTSQKAEYKKYDNMTEVVSIIEFFQTIASHLGLSASRLL